MQGFRFSRTGASNRIVAALTTVAMAAMLAVATSASASATTRDCDSERDSVYTGITSANECINGVDVMTRGTILPGCWIAAAEPIEVDRRKCSDGKIRQVERIAQTRFIQYLSDPLRGDIDQIKPGVQWETKVVTNTGFSTVLGEADVLKYVPNATDPSTNAVDVWEVKLASNGGIAAAALQVNAYKLALANEFGWQAARLGPVGYNDYFEVKEYNKCTDGKTLVNGRYNVSTPLPGVVLVTELPAEGCPDQQTVDEYGHATTEAGAYAPADTEEPNTTGTSPAGTTPLHVDLDTIDTFFKVYVAAQTVYDILRTESFAVCTNVGNIGTHGAASSVSDEGWACFAAGKTMEESLALLGANATKAQIDAIVAPFLVVLMQMVRDGKISAEQLAQILGGDTVEADRLVATSQARASGDPHLITLDGLNYDMQSVGEFVLASVPGGGAEIQARFTAATSSLSVVNSLAINLGDSWIELRPDGSVLIDQAAVQIADGEGLKFADGSLLVREGGSLMAQWPRVGDESGVSLTWQPRGGVGFVGLSVPLSLAGTVTGLLGDFNGDPSNDLKLRDGTQLPATTSAAYLHDGYADSWRIHSTESMFTYPDGKSTLDYTDKSFPSNIVTRGDFSETQRVQAMATCQAYGVAAGPSFDDCELDVMATGSWAYAAAAAQIHVPSIVAGDAQFDDAGSIREDFEGDLPNNFSAIRVGTDAGLTTFAGPFSAAEQLRFYISQLPGHDSVNLAFDVIAFGAWDGTDSVQLAVDDKAVPLVLNWDAAEAGTLANGTQFRKLRVEVPVMHHLSQVAVTLSGNGLSAASGQGFGIDNVSANLNLVPSQAFEADLVQGVSTPLDDRIGEIGAGRLESRGAVDSYAVHVPEGADLYLDWGTLSSSVGWRVTDAAGVLLGSGLSSDHGHDLEDVPGDVTLEVFAVGAQPPVTQNYRLGLLWAPDPQDFAWDVNSTTSVVGRGLSGAGNLESPRSIDRYHFTVGEGGSRVQMQWLAYNSNWMTASLVKDDTGQVLFSSSTYEKQPTFDLQLAAGNYTFKVEPDWSRSSGRSGGYDFALYTPPAAQQFAVTLATGVEKYLRNANSLGEGSGVLETSLSVDRYTITVPEARTLKVSGFSYSTTTPTNTPMMFKMTDANGTVVREGNYEYGNAFEIPVTAGTYTFEMFASPGKNVYNSPYWLKFLLIPDPQDFAWDVSSTKSVGGRGFSGAGNLESDESVDRYHFTVGEGGSRVQMQWLAYNSNWLTASLVKDDTGQVLFSSSTYEKQPTFDLQLAAGNYTFKVEPDWSKSSGRSGGYDFALYTPPAAQQFAVTLATGVEKYLNGANGWGTGSGVLETNLSVDRYTITVPEARTLKVYGFSYSTSGDPSLAPLKFRLSDANGNVIREDYYEASKAFEIPVTAGTYTFEVFASPGKNVYNSPYWLKFLLIPDPQNFTWDVNSTVAANARGLTGAANLESASSVDRYHFVVPAGGSRVQMVWLSPLSNTDTCRGLVSLTNDATGESLFSDSTYNKMPAFDLQLAAGNYTFKVEPDWSTSGCRSGGYNFALYTPPAAQVFSFALATGVETYLRNANSVGAGSGVLETKLSVDRYTITVPEARALKVYGFSYSTTNPLSTPMMFKMTDANGTVVREGNYEYGNAFEIPVTAGTYTFEVFASPGKNVYNEPYWLKFLLIPDPQNFTWDVNSTVAANARGLTGAANLESASSVDRYHFVVPAGGDRVQMVWLMYMANTDTCRGLVSLTNDATGESLFSDSTYNKMPAFDLQLAAGNYTFKVEPDWSSSGCRSGGYNFALYTPPAAQQFAVTLATGVEKYLNGANGWGTGSGVLETKLSVDRYTITVPEARTLKVYGFSYSTTTPTNTPMMFKMTDANGMVVREGNYEYGNAFEIPVTAGTYTFEMFASPGKNVYNSPYWLKFLLIPDPQNFTWDVNSTVAASSRGLSGAANLESVSSVDRYHVTVPAGGKRVALNWLSPLSNTDTCRGLVSLTNDATGVVVFSDVTYNKKPTFDLQLAEGAYTFVVEPDWSSSGCRSGGYNFALYAQPDPQVFTVPLVSGVEKSMTSAGAWGVGSGVVETNLSVDRYTITVPEARTLKVYGFSYSTSGDPSLAPLKFRLSDANGNVIREDYYEASKAFEIPVTAGTYTFEVFASPLRSSYNSPYWLKLMAY